MTITIAIIATAFSLATGIITLFWKLSRVCFQVEQNTKDIDAIGKNLRENLIPKEIITDLQRRNEENDAIIRTLDNRLTSIESKIDMLLKENK